MKTVRLIMAVHNHQPVGNFDHIIEQACAQAYHPFLDIAEKFPSIRMVLHISGSLFEWAERHDPRLLDRVAEGVRSRRFELLGGGIAEPILAMLPDRDTLGQIDAFRRCLESRCGAVVRGAWLPERVWEPHFPYVLNEAKVEYTVVDDYHFRCAGMDGDRLTGYYLTEDRGRLLRVFSGSEFLRYAIPFKDPEATIEYLRGFATEDGQNVIVYADDGEKFGLWPETFKHVYEDEWLLRFFKALDENRDWINFTGFAETVDELPPAGRAYLPNASYREMTKWVLPATVQMQYEDVVKDLKSRELIDAVRPFMRGGFWRGFRVKYPEAMQLYARMMEVSGLVAERSAARRVEEARRELYRGQCNCPYWHGVFGGLYMPFLRFATYQHLLNAENLLSRKNERAERRVEDFDLDGRPEVKLRNAHLAAYLKPDRGGALYELDDRHGPYNLTAVMTRRPEAYHRRLVEAARQLSESSDNAQTTASIHDRVRWREPGLEQLLDYDAYMRDCLVDHFYSGGPLPADLKTGRAPEWGDFVNAEYEIVARPTKTDRVTLRREGQAGPPGADVPVILSKQVSLGKAGTLDVRYVLGFPEGAPEHTLFAPEMNLGLMAGNAPDRNYFTDARENLGNLSTLLNRRNEPALGLVDEWLGVEIWLRATPPAGFWTYPVETINESEGGFERVYQGSAVLPYWLLTARPGEEQVFDLTVEVSHP